MDEMRRSSRWMMRALEWDEPRARYPNLWHQGMPRHVMAFDTVGRRLRLGDLIAVYHPASSKHEERSNRFLGISRVTGLRRSERAGFCWIDLETAHRFEPALDLGVAPRRVFLCCDPGWPDQDVGLFERVFAAAVEAGWTPAADESAPPAHPATIPAAAADDRAAGRDRPAETGPASEPGPPPARSVTSGRAFAGVDYSGDMRDPRDRTWLAVTRLNEGTLHVVHLEPTGRHGLQARLRDPDALLMDAEAIGLDFPFGVPMPFAERLLGGPFPDEGWWALARRFERLTRPEYLVAIQDFRDTEGEPRRLTDERVQAFSPLHRVNPDLGPMTFHGIRMIAEERSRYAVKPFESAQARLLLEVYPGGLVREMSLPADGDRGKRLRTIVERLAKLEELPVTIPEPYRSRCLASRDALDAVIAARCAARAVLTGEALRSPEELAPEAAGRVRAEGWIYGL